MSEEVQDASKTVPNVVMWAVGSNAVMLLIVGITYIFCLGNVENVLDTPTYQPVIQVFYNATKSKAGTNTMIAVIIIVFLSACVGQVATASRQLWSFARDRGMYTQKSLKPPSLTSVLCLQVFRFRHGCSKCPRIGTFQSTQSLYLPS